MFGSRKALSAVFTATLIALGALVTWYLVVFPVVQYFEARKARSRLYEQLTVLADGTPLLAVSRGGIAAAEYRDLQGDVVAKGPFPSALQGTGFQAATQPSAPDLPHPIAPAVSLPVDVGVLPGWRGRIMGLSDRPGAVEGPATLWYFIRGPRNRGGGYFQGYDERTRQLIGFIGAEGYQANRPVGDERLVWEKTLTPTELPRPSTRILGNPV